MATLEAIIFDVDGVVADCRRSVLLSGAARFIRDAASTIRCGGWSLHARRSCGVSGWRVPARRRSSPPHAELVVSGLAALTLDMLVTLVTTET